MEERIKNNILLCKIIRKEIKIDFIEDLQDDLPDLLTQFEINEINEILTRKFELPIEFSVDLAKATKIYFSLNDYLFENSFFRDENFLRYSFVRYRQFISLLDTFDNEGKFNINNNENYDNNEINNKIERLIPPEDVDVIWSSHLIRQLKYRKVRHFLINFNP